MKFIFENSSQPYESENSEAWNRLRSDREELHRYFDRLYRDKIRRSDYRWKMALKKEKELDAREKELTAQDSDKIVTNKRKLSAAITKVSGLQPIKTRTTSVRGYRPVSSGSFEIQYYDLSDSMDVYFYRDTDKIEDVVSKLAALGYDIKYQPGKSMFQVSVYQNKINDNGEHADDIGIDEHYYCESENTYSTLEPDYAIDYERDVEDTEIDSSFKPKAIALDLLSAEEARELPKDVIKYYRDWWLQWPGGEQYKVNCASYYGSLPYMINFGDYVDDDNCVRPALTLSNLDSSNFKLYGEYMIFNEKWIFIGKNKFLYNDEEIVRRFDAESNDYESSEVKKFLNRWLRKLQNRVLTIEEI